MAVAGGIGEAVAAGLAGAQEAVGGGVRDIGPGTVGIKGQGAVGPGDRGADVGGLAVDGDTVRTSEPSASLSLASTLPDALRVLGRGGGIGGGDRAVVGAGDGEAEGGGGKAAVAVAGGIGEAVAAGLADRQAVGGGVRDIGPGTVGIKGQGAVGPGDRGADVGGLAVDGTRSGHRSRRHRCRWRARCRTRWCSRRPWIVAASAAATGPSLAGATLMVMVFGVRSRSTPPATVPPSSWTWKVKLGYGAPLASAAGTEPLQPTERDVGGAYEVAGVERCAIVRERAGARHARDADREQAVRRCVARIREPEVSRGEDVLRIFVGGDGVVSPYRRVVHRVDGDVHHVGVGERAAGAGVAAGRW